jgi:hypothetical protein
MAHCDAGSGSHPLHQWRTKARHPTVQCQVGHDLLQPTVLVFELLEPLHLGRQQTCILLLPIEVCRLADASLAADLGNWCAFLALLDDERLLRVQKLRCLHLIPLLSQPGNRSGKLQPQTVQFAGIRSLVVTSHTEWGRAASVQTSASASTPPSQMRLVAPRHTFYALP